jgi:cystathionine beta-lyase
MAPSKTFNVPGLGSSFAVVQNPDLLKRLHKAQDGIVPHPNALGYAAMQAAYAECQAWLDALLIYLRDNRDTLVAYIDQHFPNVVTTCPEGTYLAWLDFRKAGIPGNVKDFFLKEAHVMLSDGKIFGDAGEGFVRLNFGCPRSMLVDALDRMRAVLERLGEANTKTKTKKATQRRKDTKVQRKRG